MVLQTMLGRFEQQKAEIENQDIDAYVLKQLEEAEKQIRAEAEQKKAYALKVIDIKIEAINEAIAESERATAVAEESEALEAPEGSEV